jgi:NADH:ubiquinone oxidoreductase subunit 3 (subunit A)
MFSLIIPSICFFFIYLTKILLPAEPNANKLKNYEAGGYARYSYFEDWFEKLNKISA